MQWVSFTVRCVLRPFSQSAFGALSPQPIRSPRCFSNVISLLISNPKEPPCAQINKSWFTRLVHSGERERENTNTLSYK